MFKSMVVASCFGAVSVLAQQPITASQIQSPVDSFSIRPTPNPSFGIFQLSTDLGTAGHLIAHAAGQAWPVTKYFNSEFRLDAMTTNRTLTKAAYGLLSEGNLNDDGSFSLARVALYDYVHNQTIWFYDTNNPGFFIFERGVSVLGSNFISTGWNIFPNTLGGTAPNSKLVLQSTYNQNPTYDAIVMNVGQPGGNSHTVLEVGHTGTTSWAKLPDQAAPPGKHCTLEIDDQGVITKTGACN